MKRRTIRTMTAIAAGIAVVACLSCQKTANSRTTATPRPNQERKSISLAGQWRFQLDHDDVGEQQNWSGRTLPGRVALPGSTAENGYGNDVGVETKWTGKIVDQSWFTDSKYEKYRQPGSVKIPFWLTPVKHYVGPAWYQREIDIPQNWRDKRIVLSLERCHWETKVWVDGTLAGMQDSLCTPQRHELSDLLTPGRHLLTIRVDNSVKYDVGVNAHSVSDHTQTNWNGVVGKIELHASDPVWIGDVQVYPDIREKSAKLLITLGNRTGGPARGMLRIGARSWNTNRSHAPTQKMVEFTTSEPETVVEVDYVMGNDVQLWDEFSPAMYKLTVALMAEADGNRFRDEKTVTFGMRRIGTRGTQFTINDRPIFVRGTLECCIFPLTGYPPMDVEAWLRILRIAKAHGLNHLRFHSWCPPEAAFEAADRLGFLFHVECAAWATVGNGRPIDRFIYAEGDRILKAYGNRPSFCMLAYGNEPGGPNQKRFLGKLVNSWKDKDPRRLYTSAAGWPIIPESQYHSTPRPRGHQWGAGLKSRFNANPPETVTDYRDLIEDYDIPVVSHEIGQWCVYPNFREIIKYTGVLRPLNFEIFRDSLAAHHMLDQADDFLMASGKLQALLYKEEIESALRTPGFGGFQLLDIHDFPGQGTALIGILDPFWDSKGYIEPHEHHRYCCETVPLVRMEKRTWTTDEVFIADVEIANFGPAPIRDAVAVWSISTTDGAELATGTLPKLTIPLGNDIHLGKIEVPLADMAAPAGLSVSVSLKGTPYANDWDIWVYPEKLDTQPPGDVLVAEQLDGQARSTLNAGGKVLLTPALNCIDSDVPPGFTTIFWNTQWTRRQPPHTLGILCDPKHPALARFPTEFHSNWQWWDLVTKSRFMVLDEFEPELRPIIQVVDDWNTNRRLGLVFEARVGRGKLLVCSMDLRNNLDRRPVARQMLHSLLSYMNSAAFAPKHRVETKLIEGLLKKPSLLSNARIVRVDSEAPGYEAANVIDGNPDTIWHTAWGPGAPAYPHEIRIELSESLESKGLTYLPRQDMSNGWISECEVYLSADGQEWGQPAVTARFEKGRDARRILFERSRTARFIRFVALSGFDGQEFASAAEISLVTE
ncbi:MAG: discoidin domain-containing protein [Phycisphaerales bacterium]|nr:MAG: discoidin domain-containing protein [Phycisphaerales bacterium]